MSARVFAAACVLLLAPIPAAADSLTALVKQYKTNQTSKFYEYLKRIKRQPEARSKVAAKLLLQYPKRPADARLAEELLKRKTRRTPKNAALMALAGDSYRKRREFAEAARAYQRALRLAPSRSCGDKAVAFVRRRQAELALSTGKLHAAYAHASCVVWKAPHDMAALWLAIDAVQRGHDRSAMDRLCRGLLSRKRYRQALECLIRGRALLHPTDQHLIDVAAKLPGLNKQDLARLSKLSARLRQVLAISRCTKDPQNQQRKLWRTTRTRIVHYQSPALDASAVLAALGERSNGAVRRCALAAAAAVCATRLPHDGSCAAPLVLARYAEALGSKDQGTLQAFVSALYSGKSVVYLRHPTDKTSARALFHMHLALASVFRGNGQHSGPDSYRYQYAHARTMWRRISHQPFPTRLFGPPRGWNASSGCSDGSREGFRDRTHYPRIAACSGSFVQRGLYTPRVCTLQRRGRRRRCSAADLCSPGWHICTSKGVRARATSCADASQPGRFFAAHASTPGARYSRVVGCGGLGERSSSIFANAGKGCAKLARDGQGKATGWSCAGARPEATEALYIVNSNPRAGGVLCCR